jgi:hypothetical protein
MSTSTVGNAATIVEFRASRCARGWRPATTSRYHPPVRATLELALANARRIATRPRGFRPTVEALHDQARAMVSALRLGVAPLFLAGELPAAAGGAASTDGSVVTLSFEAGACAVLEPPPRDRVLRRRRRYYQEFMALVTLLTPGLSGAAHLHLRDEHPSEPIGPLPQLVFNRARAATHEFVVMPDVHFVKHRGYPRLRRELARTAPPWERRRAIALWRGSSTGGSLGRGEDYRNNARVALCLLSLDAPRLVDARLGRVVDCHPEVERELTARGLVDRFVAPREQAQARYLVSVDGWAAEWDGLVWKLASGSTVLMVESRWELWYGAALRPWEHYVPVRADLSDLGDRVEWCRDHDVECRAIAERAGAWAERELTFAAAVRFAQKQLLGLAQT